MLIGDTIFVRRLLETDSRRGPHFPWSFEPHKGLAVCRGNEVASFLSYVKTLSIGPMPGIEPATPALQWNNNIACRDVNDVTTPTVV